MSIRRGTRKQGTVPSSVKVTSNFKSLADVRTAMLTKLEESSLDASDARTLHLQPYTAVDVAARFKSLPYYRAGFHIPYFDLHGRLTKFFRFRYLEYDSGRGFSKLTHSNNGKPQKHDLRYVQLGNTLPSLYFSPVMDWEEIAKNPETILVVTEGELKAACACKNGFATIGLGGVWSFKSNSAGMKLLPEFAEIEWKGRDVYICYDSDLESNPDVAMARNKLAFELMQLGARVLICSLPTLPNEKKTGLDDYITALGGDAFKVNVLASAVEYRATEELYRLNAEVVYVRDPGVIMRLDTLQRMTPRAFVEHAYSDRVWTEQVNTGNGGMKLVDRCAPKEWLRWPHRATVERVTYKPGEGRYLTSGELNVWRGWGTEPARGDVAQWHQLMDFVFADHEDREARKKWFQQWLAYPLQHPGVKLNQSVVIWSVDQGTGKSVIGYVMQKIYGSNFTEINDKSLQSGFNEWAENKQFVMGDEIASSGDKKRDTADRMKSLITQRELRLNPKYVPSYTVPDCINYYFTSNHPDAFFMEDTDRRFFVTEIKRRPLPDTFYTEFCNWTIHGGPGAAAVFDYLLHFDLSDFNPQGHAPQTTSKDEMIANARSDVANWVAKLRQDPDSVLRIGGAAVNHKIWSTEELYTLFDPQEKSRVTINGLARELRRSGFKRLRDGGQIRTQTRGIQRLWAIRDADTLLQIIKPVQIAAIYDKERGGRADKKRY